MTDELARLEEEVRNRQGRIRAIKMERVREQAADLEAFEAMDGHAHRQLYEDDPETWRAFMKQLQEKNERALADRPFLGTNRRQAS